MKNIFRVGAQIEKGAICDFWGSSSELWISRKCHKVAGWVGFGWWVPGVDKAIGNKFWRKKRTGINLVIWAIELKRKVPSLMRVTGKM